MPKLGYYEMGVNNAVCDQCGRAFKSNQLKKRWDNAWTCNMCWEPRHPQDFVRGIKDNQAPALDRPRAAMPQYYLRLLDCSVDRVFLNNDPTKFLLSDLDIRAKIKVTNWATSFVGVCIKGKVENGGSLSDIFFNFGTVIGPLQFYFVPNGSQIFSINSSLPTGFANNSTNWIRLTVDIDNGVQSVFKFYTSNDYDQYEETGTWSQLGTEQTRARITSVVSNQAPFTIGSSLGDGADVFYAEVRSGIDGEIIYSCDPNNRTSNGKIATDNDQFQFVGSAELVEI